MQRDGGAGRSAAASAAHQGSAAAVASLAASFGAAAAPDPAAAVRVSDEEENRIPAREERATFSRKKPRLELQRSEAGSQGTLGAKKGGGAAGWGADGAAAPGVGASRRGGAGGWEQRLQPPAGVRACVFSAAAPPRSAAAAAAGRVNAAALQRLAADAVMAGESAFDADAC